MSYRNPVIPGFHPDPSVSRFGDRFVLVTSSFTYFPGVPVFVSDDLVDWTQVGHALDRVSQLDLAGTEGWSSAGIFAPTIRYHDGRLWMITTVFNGANTPSFFVTATDPAGPWSEPVMLTVAGIDPDLAWDDDGNCWVHSSAGPAGVMRYRIDDATGEVLDGPEPTWSGTGMQYPEAPHLLRRGPWWYLLIAEGGTERGHAVSIARGPSPTGPWESCPANPILSHRSTDRPIQNTGHADLVEAPDGSWWMVLLGTRPRGVTPAYHVLGRETFLTPVDWVDDWPVPRELTLEMDAVPPGSIPGSPSPTWTVRDDFDDATLAPRWVSVRAPLGDAVSPTERPGWLTLRGDDRGLDDPRPVLVGCRQQLQQCRARTLAEVGAGPGAAEAGLVVRMDERHHYEVTVAGSEVVVRARVGDLANTLAEVTAPTGPVTLRIDMVDGAASLVPTAPDAVRLGFEHADGTLEVLAELDGRYLSTEVTGGFIGRVIGIYAVRGVARFDWFELTDASG